MAEALLSQGDLAQEVRVNYSDKSTLNIEPLKAKIVLWKRQEIGDRRGFCTLGLIRNGPSVPGSCSDSFI